MITANGTITQLNMHVVPVHFFKIPCTVKATTAGQATVSMQLRIILTRGLSFSKRVCSATSWYVMKIRLLAPCLQGQNVSHRHNLRCYKSKATCNRKGLVAD